MSVLEPAAAPATTSALAERGWGDDELRAMVGAGRLVRLRRGAYADAADARLATPEGRHLLLVRTTVPLLSEDAVVSHGSAATLHAMTLWRFPLGPVQVTRARRSGGRVHRVVQVRTAPLTDDEVVVVGGVRATSPARTLVDVLRNVPFEQGVVAADAALRSGAVSRPALHAALGRARGWPGVPRARRVVAFADPRSESVGESRSRVAIARIGLPAPRPQLDVVDRAHRLVGRCDFGWEQLGTVGEFDGRVKYGRGLDPARDAGDVAFAEKVREDALRDAGWEVTRWIWSELSDFRPVEARIRRAFARAARRRR